jgi:hypothetical protein
MMVPLSFLDGVTAMTIEATPIDTLGAPAGCSGPAFPDIRGVIDF